jgi:SNF2 family DNA or RNA helicase
MNLIGDTFTETYRNFQNKYMNSFTLGKTKKVIYQGFNIETVSKLYDRLKLVSIAIEKNQVLYDLSNRSIQKVFVNATQEQKEIIRALVTHQIGIWQLKHGQLALSLKMIANMYARMVSGGHITFTEVTREKVLEVTKKSCDEICSACKSIEACRVFCNAMSLEEILPFNLYCLERINLEEQYKIKREFKVVQRMEMENAKITWILNFLKDTESKVTIFAEFTEDLNIIEEALIVKNIKYKRVDGSNTKHRISIVNTFRKENYKVLLCQISTAVGFNAVEAVKAIYYSVGYKLGDYLQSRDRIYRKGQTADVEEFWLITKNSLEPKIWGKIEAKKELKNIITKNRTGDMFEEECFIFEVEEILESFN